MKLSKKHKAVIISLIEIGEFETAISLLEEYDITVPLNTKAVILQQLKERKQKVIDKECFSSEEYAHRLDMLFGLDRKSGVIVELLDFIKSI